jgi:hypothetical protein
MKLSLQFGGAVIDRTLTFGTQVLASFYSFLGFFEIIPAMSLQNQIKQIEVPGLCII